MRRRAGRRVPGGNLKKPLTMMGPAAVAVAVTTLRTRARLHTVHTAAWRHCSVLATTGDNAGILHFNPQGVAPGPQLLSGTDEI